MPSERDLLHLLRAIRRRLDANVSLDALASRAGWSPFHLHRAFTRMVGETPKQYTLRLRLEGAAARLLASDDSIVDVALAAGFNSHEVFTRAFRRHFGRTPAEYARPRSPVRRQKCAHGIAPSPTPPDPASDSFTCPSITPLYGDLRCPFSRSNDASSRPSRR